MTKRYKTGYMKNFFIFCMGALALAACGSVRNTGPSAIEDVKQYRYELSCAGSQGNGLITVNVVPPASASSAAGNICRACAVHGIIFKGCYGRGVTRPALVRSANGYADNQEFFDEFFNGGGYLKFTHSAVFRPLASGASHGRRSSGTVTVDVRMLRRYLEQAGILKGLNAGF